MNQTNENMKENNGLRSGINAALVKRGMTQRQLAEKMGQHPVALNTTIGNPNIQLGTLQKIAEAIGCDITEFFERDEGMTCPHCGGKIRVTLSVM